MPFSWIFNFPLLEANRRESAPTKEFENNRHLHERERIEMLTVIEQEKRARAKENEMNLCRKINILLFIRGICVRFESERGICTDNFTKWL
jgi:hypothetical protein